VKNGSLIKNETVGGKVLQNKTRSTAQEEVLMTAVRTTSNNSMKVSSLLDWRKSSEGASGGGEKEGRTWKRFQSYKCESTLPWEVDSLRVSRSTSIWNFSGCTNVSPPYLHRWSLLLVYPTKASRLAFRLT
jgi:hypothetical protein